MDIMPAQTFVWVLISLLWRPAMGANMKILAVVLIVVGLFLVGCSVFGGSGSGDATVDTESDPLQTSTERSQEKAFAGLRWMLYAGIALAGIGIGLLFLPVLRSWGIPCLASGGFIAFMAITLNQHYILISWIGLGVGLAGIGLLAWLVWKNKDKLQASASALFQVVAGNELAKKLLPDDLKAKIYGSDDPNAPPGIAEENQTFETVNLVSAIRSKVNVK